MGALILKTPELILTPEESETLAKAIQNVTELYEVSVVDEKTMAWIQLAIAAGAIYGPRFVAVSLDRKKKAERARGPQPVPRPADPFAVVGGLGV